MSTQTLPIEVVIRGGDTPEKIIPLRPRKRNSTRILTVVGQSDDGSWAVSHVEMPVQVESTTDSATVLERAIRDVFAREQRFEWISHRLGLSAERLLDAIESSVITGSSAASRHDQSVLREAGISLEGPVSDPHGFVKRLEGQLAVVRLTAEALSIAEAAELLGVSTARIRQRIANGEMISIHTPSGRALPRWQFVDEQLVPGLVGVTAVVQELHPLAVENFMTRPNADLVVNDVPLSPVAWLTSGGDVETVADLIESLTYE